MLAKGTVLVLVTVLLACHGGALSDPDLRVAEAKVLRRIEVAERGEPDDELKATHAEDLRDRVRPTYKHTGPDAKCTANKLPPYRWVYVGATFRENEEVAAYDHCRKLDYPEYCCPYAPPQRSPREHARARGTALAMR